MSQPKVLVTGATGKTGSAVVDVLLSKGVPVRALVHQQDIRSRHLQSRGAEVVVADMFDADQVFDAVRGTQRAYFLPFFHTLMIQSAVTFALAAKEAKLESIVHMGQWLSHRSHPAIMTRQTWLIDQLFADLPLTAHTTINPGMFADNFLRVMDYAALLGIFPVLTGEGRAAVVSNEDLARVAAAVLMSPERHAGKSYRPTGPKLYSGREMADVAQKVVGHRVIPVKLPYWLFLKVARQQGINPLEISGFQHYVLEMARGTFELDGGVTDVVQELTGTPAEDLEPIARRYAAMPFATQTLSNRVKAFVRFNMVPFYRGYNLKKWERAQGIPMPPLATLSVDDQRWKDEHHKQMTDMSPSLPSLDLVYGARS